jgi:ABC-type branched-subunit amino acid transport system substrate-binding protein
VRVRGRWLLPVKFGWGLGAIAVGAAALAADASCTSYGKGGGDGGQNPAGPPIVIGASIGLTGVLDGQVRALKGGLATAEAQINAIGGILNRQVSFQIEDDASQPTVATQVMKTLLSDKVFGVVGPGLSSEVQAVYPLISKAQTVEISATATSILLTSGYSANQGWFFRTVPGDDEQGKAVAQFALRGPKGKDASSGQCTKMAILYDMDSYGQPMDAIIEPYFKHNGGQIVMSQGISPEATGVGSYMPEANEIVSKRPDCMAMVVIGPVGDQLVQAVTMATSMDKSHDWSNFFIIGTDGCYTPLFISDGRVNPSDPKSTSFVQGVYGTTADTNPPDRQAYNDLKTLYQAEVGYASGMTDLDPYTSSEYDAAILLALAIQAAGTTDGPAVQKAMFKVSSKGSNAMAYGPAQVPDAIEALKRGEAINYDGAAGDEDFDAFGNVVGDFIVWQVQDNAFVTHDYVKAKDLE